VPLARGQALAVRRSGAKCGLPAGPNDRPARHSFNGTLVLSSAEMETLPETLESRTVFDRDTKLFPDVSIDFFTHEDHLVPADRDLIRSGSLAPGGSF